MSSNSTGVSGTDSEDQHAGANDLDVVMELLADHRRRHVLYCLRSSDCPLDSERLAERIVDLDDRTTRDKREILIELRHNHIPKMDAAGVIEWESDGIRFDGSETLIESYLDLTAELEPDVSFR
ncbi:hypothetical protein [Haladaptatus sp. AB643]|uniref:DUF7344 domain-containing protein n=1 Tax=Haladaptatus sp. AB643 TaxID=2934174 RepID=UPI00209C193A|nr:hypothetical protein [Haladaptatus sp. AB643]MCO8245159.1 hypothetical protein [Haladaptatus sp. AB643]